MWLQILCAMLLLQQAAAFTSLRPPQLRACARQSGMAMYARSLVWLSSGDLRTHDNEALHEAMSRKHDIVPAYIVDPAHIASMPPHTIRLLVKAISDVRSSLQGLGSDLVVRVGPVEQQLPELMEQTEAESIWHHVDVQSSQRDLTSRGIKSLLDRSGSISVHPWTTCLRSKLTVSGDNYKDYVAATRGVLTNAPLPRPDKLHSASLPEDRGRVPSFEELLSLAYDGHDDAMRTARVAAEREEYLTPTYDAEEGGETLALRWLEQYLDEGPEVFGAKHLPMTGDGLERQAIRRIIQAQGMAGLFEGEVFNRCFSPLLGLGCLSPRYVAQAARDRAAIISPITRYLSLPPPPMLAKLDAVVEAREWHTVLAEKDLKSPPVPEPMEFKYWRWHGHLVRYAVSRGQGPEDKDKPAVVLVHGFGASSDQWAKCFKELSQRFRVFALDMLGFGHSEKPAVHFTQYLWQDQVRDFALEIVRGPYFIGGNSIGGYTAMSVAADSRGLCKGLILINTAGKVLTPGDYQAEVEGRAGRTMEDMTRAGTLPELTGPPRFLLRGASLALFAYLQPRIESICKNLYKKYPDQVGPRLVRNIFRDSCDPGALDVFASGARLPPPRPANELLNKFGGPVLVAQGILDPLNDAKGRAELLKKAREGVKVVSIEGGHCVHDEDPVATCRAIEQFVDEVLVGFKELQASSGNLEEPPQAVVA